MELPKRLWVAAGADDSDNDAVAQDYNPTRTRIRSPARGRRVRLAESGD